MLRARRAPGRVLGPTHADRPGDVVVVTSSVLSAGYMPGVLMSSGLHDGSPGDIAAGTAEWDVLLGLRQVHTGGFRHTLWMR